MKQFEANDAEALMRGLSRQYHYHSDPAAVDISCVLRLPGLHNKKYDLTFQVTAQKLTSTVYTPGCFPVYQPASSATALRRSPSTLVNTPSHRDWAYVCGELWKAADPAAVETRLIDELVRRAQLRNKPKPRYYAELTVSKARSYIATKRDSSSGPQMNSPPRPIRAFRFEENYSVPAHSMFRFDVRRLSPVRRSPRDSCGEPGKSSARANGKAYCHLRRRRSGSHRAAIFSLV